MLGEAPSGFSLVLRCLPPAVGWILAAGISFYLLSQSGCRAMGHGKPQGGRHSFYQPARIRPLGSAGAGKHSQSWVLDYDRVYQQLSYPLHEEDRPRSSPLCWDFFRGALLCLRSFPLGGTVAGGSEEILGAGRNPAPRPAFFFFFFFF